MKRKNIRSSNKNILKNNKGITLIALVVTIVVLLILATVSVQLLVGENGVITKAKEASFKTELSKIDEEFNLYLTSKKLKNMEFEPETLNAYETMLSYNTITDEEKSGNIYTVLKTSKREEVAKMEITKGELLYTAKNAREAKWAQDLGIKINPYIVENGELKSSNGNLGLVGSIGTLVIPETVRGETIISIGEGAFGNLEGVRKIVIPSTVKEIQKSAFYRCTGIEEVVFETRVENGKEIGTEKIGDYAFCGCTNLVSMELPNTVTSLGERCFASCSNLTNVVLSNNMTEIPSYAFCYGTSLKQITIPEGVSSIRQEAFKSCINLQTIRLPKSLTQISLSTFTACKNLNNIEITEGNTSFAFGENILFNKTKTQMIYILPSAIPSNKTTFTVPSTVTTLGQGTLSNFPQITKVVIPASVKNISDFRFFTENMSQIEIDENNPTYMADGVGIYNKDKTTLYMYYKDAKAVTNIELDDNIKSLNKYAFFLCRKLKSLTIGKNVSNIGWDWTWNSRITNLTTINIDAENPYYMSEGHGIYNKEKTKLIGVFGRVTEFEIPYGVTEIGSYSFYSQANLNQVIIPNTVTKIESYAFYRCYVLSTIEIPSSVTSIGIGCFLESNKLEKIQINKKKDSISGSPWSAPIGERAIQWAE